MATEYVRIFFSWTASPPRLRRATMTTVRSLQTPRERRPLAPERGSCKAPGSAKDHARSSATVSGGDGAAFIVVSIVKTHPLALKALAPVLIQGCIGSYGSYSATLLCLIRLASKLVPSVRSRHA